MRTAAPIGALQQRSAAQQVETWASLGRNVAGLLDPEQLLSVTAGVARLRLEADQQRWHPQRRHLCGWGVL